MSLIGGLLSLTIYARMLGPETYGRLAVYLALVEAFQGICFQWHRLALVRFWGGLGHAEADAYLKTSHLTWIFIAIVGTFVWLVVVIFSGGHRGEWAVVAFVALGKSAALYTQEIARASGSVIRYALASLLLTVGATCIGIFAWLASHSMTLTLLATAATFILQTVLCGYDHAGVIWRACFDKAQLRTMLAYGLPLVPVFLATTALTRIDRPILAGFEDSSVVGIYAATTGLVANAIAAACLLVVTPSYPWLLREKQLRSELEHRALHAKIGLLMLTGVLALSIVIVLARDLAIPILLGRTIGIAAQPIVEPLLTIAVIGAFRTHFFDQAYHLHARTKALMVINISTLIMAVCGIYAGAYLFGLHGLIGSMIFVNFLSLIISGFFARKLVDMRRVLKNGGYLLAIFCFSIWFGEVLRKAIQIELQSSTLATIISTAIGVILFVGTYLIGNFGLIRYGLSRRL